MEKVSERFSSQDGVFALLPGFKLDKKSKIGLPEQKEITRYQNNLSHFSCRRALRDPSHFVGPSLFHGRGWPWAIKMEQVIF